MPRPDDHDTAPSRRIETGDVILLLQATLDQPDAAGRLQPERCTVTAKVVRSVTGEIVASTRLSTVDEAAGPPSPEERAALSRAAQDLADRIIAQVRRHLAGQPTSAPGERRLERSTALTR